jgi:hypothetical protein
VATVTEQGRGRFVIRIYQKSSGGFARTLTRYEHSKEGYLAACIRAWPKQHLLILGPMAFCKPQLSGYKPALTLNGCAGRGPRKLRRPGRYRPSNRFYRAIFGGSVATARTGGMTSAISLYAQTIYADTRQTRDKFRSRKTATPRSSRSSRIISNVRRRSTQGEIALRRRDFIWLRALLKLNTGAHGASWSV